MCVCLIRRSRVRVCELREARPSRLVRAQRQSSDIKTGLSLHHSCCPVLVPRIAS